MNDTPDQPQIAEPQPAPQFSTIAAFHPHMFPAHAPMPTFQSPVIMPVSMAPIPILDHTGIFLAGFRDCAAEAIKYLTENEQMSEADPAIQGLRQHLCTRQDVLKQSSTPPSTPEKQDASNASRQSDSHSTPSKGLNESTSDEGYSSILQEHSNTSTPIHPSFSCPQFGQFSNLNGSYPVFPVFSMTSVPPSPIVSNVTPCVTSPVMSSSVINGGSQIDSLLEAHAPSLESPKDLPDLAALAQANPAIASVAQELVDLLQEELDDSIDCEDEDEDEEMEEDEADRSS